MFRDLTPYDDTTETHVPWAPAAPSHWGCLPGAGVLREVPDRNSDLRETVVLSLSFGKVVVKPQEKMRGLVPSSFDSYQVLQPGDIVVRPTDLQNDQRSVRVGLVRDRGIITSAYLGLRARAHLTPDYAYLQLAALDAMKVFYGMGSGLRQNLEWQDFKRLPLLAPPLDEQAAIVKYLAHAHRRLDRAIAAKRKLITLLEEQRQAIISQGVTRGLDPTAPTKECNIPWLGAVPAHWQVVELKRALLGLIDCEHKTAPYSSDGVHRVVRTTAVRRGELNWAGTYPTSPAAYAEWTRRGKPAAGDVIFTREAPAGEACVVPPGVEVCLGQRTVLMRVDRRRCDPRFLVHQIYAGAPREQIRVATQGSTVGHFNMDDIGWMRILLPPLEQQVAIADHLDDETAATVTAVERIQAEIELLREFRTRLTSDVVTGQVDVRRAAAALPEFDPQEVAVDVSGIDDDVLDEAETLLVDLDA